LEVIDKWHDFDYLKKEVEFIVIVRGHRIEKQFGIKIKKIIDLKKEYLFNKG
jgi:nicotinic acid mononucleotide adenylyltransferase